MTYQTCKGPNHAILIQTSIKVSSGFHQISDVIHEILPIEKIKTGSGESCSSYPMLVFHFAHKMIQAKLRKSDEKTRLRLNHESLMELNEIS